MELINSELWMVINALRGGGAENVCIKLANKFAEDGKRVSLIVLMGGEGAMFSRLKSEITVYDLKLESGPSSVTKLAAFLQKFQPEIMLSFNFEVSVKLILARFISGAKTKIVSRSIIHYSSRIVSQSKLSRRYFNSLIIRLFFGHIDKCVCQCEEMKQDLLVHFPSLKDKTIVIGNPVKLNPIGSRDERGHYLLCVGRLEEQKNFKDAIIAFSIIKKQLPELRLVVLGEGSQRKYLEDLAFGLGVADSVDFLSFVNNVDEFYRKARCTLLTSKFEGFPNVLLESLSNGTPCVSYNCPSGPKEIIENGVNGFLVKVGDTASLASSTINVIKTNFNRKVVAETVQEYSIERVAARYLDEVFEVNLKDD